MCQGTVVREVSQHDLGELHARSNTRRPRLQYSIFNVQLLAFPTNLIYFTLAPCPYGHLLAPFIHCVVVHGLSPYANEYSRKAQQRCAIR